jgi:putative ABC transport system substrate-binding protein
VPVVNRRNLVVSLSLGFTVPSVLRAQRAPRTIGVLILQARLQVEGYAVPFNEAMRELGYVRGRDYVIVERFAEGRMERLPDLANELVRLKVDVIAASSTNTVAVAQRATDSVPIVFMDVSDPVRAGFADSLAHPGHNMTGLSNLTGDLTPKRLQLLKQMVPGLVRVSYLANPTNPYYPGTPERMRALADQLGLRLLLINASTRDEIELGFRTMAEQRTEALLVSPDAYLYGESKQITELALASRLPSMFAFAEIVETGGLMSYGADSLNAWRQLAKFVDKIFKGERPGDLPIQQPMKIDLVINRRTADALGLTIPHELRMQAAKVIE